MCVLTSPIKQNVDWYFKDPVQANYWRTHILYLLFFQFGIFCSTL